MQPFTSNFQLRLRCSPSATLHLRLISCWQKNEWKVCTLMCALFRKHSPGCEPPSSPWSSRSTSMDSWQLDLPNIKHFVFILISSRVPRSSMCSQTRCFMSFLPFWNGKVFSVYYWANRQKTYKMYMHYCHKFGVIEFHRHAYSKRRRKCQDRGNCWM